MLLTKRWAALVALEEFFDAFAFGLFRGEAVDRYHCAALLGGWSQLPQLAVDGPKDLLVKGCGG